MYQDQARPYGSQQAGRVFLHQFKHGSRGLVLFAVAAALAGLAIGAASLALLLTYRSTATAQIHQLQQAVSSAQSNSASNTYSITGQAAKLTSIEAALAAIGQFNTVCSQDLTGPSGPAQFDFMCRLHP